MIAFGKEGALCKLKEPAHTEQALLTLLNFIYLSCQCYLNCLFLIVIVSAGNCKLYSGAGWDVLHNVVQSVY